jgi:hypothetical protein
MHVNHFLLYIQTKLLQHTMFAVRPPHLPQGQIQVCVGHLLHAGAVNIPDAGLRNSSSSKQRFKQRYKLCCMA